MPKQLLIANWKANPATLREAIVLAQKTELAVSRTRGVDVVIAPPFPFLTGVISVLKRVKLGCQNSFWEDTGPYTGEVSWRQLKNLKVRYGIVGHSERRLFLCENDDMINKKVRALLEHGFTAILCVGERERSGNEMSEEVGQQLMAGLAGIKKNLLKNLIIAYEPVWAISTMPNSQPDTPQNAFHVAIFIRRVMIGMFGRECGEKIKVIYGGSVNKENISSFLTDGHMQGALVGGASLNPEEFSSLIEKASEV